MFFCIYETFSNFLFCYQLPLFRKLKWFGIINKQKSEAKMIKNFREKFGAPDNVLVCIGDWSRTQTPKNQEPTKGKSIRKLFRNAGYNIYLVNEFRTSKMSYLLENESNQEMEKYKKIPSPRPWQKGKLIKCHGLLRSKCVLKNTANKHLIMNRDLNGSLNILYKAQCYMTNVKIPKYFINQ